ncbi:hypothetical protein [Paenibacillus sp. FSL R5-0701]|uniref:hypothetical protein n=1 Tax=Paenibacillus sp. FSL R5-0701 TaxID=2921654 RepID=UPI0030CADA8A
MFDNKERAEKQKSEAPVFQEYFKIWFAPSIEEQKGSKEVVMEFVMWLFEPDVHTITERAEKTEEAERSPLSSDFPL